MNVIKASAMVTLSQILWEFSSECARSVYCNVMTLALLCCQYTFIMNLVSKLASLYSTMQ
jgi:hypothetical protein